MIKLYTVRGNLPSERAKCWLASHNLDFEEFDLSKKKMNKDDLIQMLSSTNKGIYDIIPKKTEAYRQLNVDLRKTFHLDELIDAIDLAQELLKLPLMVDVHYIQVGFDELEFEMFFASR